MKCGTCKTKIPEGKMRCPNCGKWANLGASEVEVHKLLDVQASDLDRLVSGPWDVAWGGGIVTDSVSFFAGQWGAGKSTLLLQIAQAVASQGKAVLYISKEETLGRVKSRAVRLGIPDDAQERIQLVARFSGTIRDVCDHVAPQLLILDSLPAFAGIGWGNVKEAVEVLTSVKDYANEMKCPAIVVDHVNKEGEFSGPEAFAHLVDMTVFFKKDVGMKNRRWLVPEKNRDGDVNVRVGFDMTSKGLVHVVVDEETFGKTDEDVEETDTGAVYGSGGFEEKC